MRRSGGEGAFHLSATVAIDEEAVLVVEQEMPRGSLAICPKNIVPEARGALRDVSP